MPIDPTMTFAISRGDRATVKAWTSHEYTLAQLWANMFEFHRESNSKDGPAFTASALVGAVRKIAAVKSLSLAVFDIDGAQTFEEVVEIVKNSGFTALVYTTYSHKSKTTFVRTNSYMQWAKKAKQPDRHTEDSIKAYLRDNKKAHLIVTKVHADPETTAEGNSIRIDHEQVDKCRVVFPMAAPFVMVKAAYGHTEATKLWKRTYAGIGNKLGLAFDESCMDPTRLYYYPSHPAGAVNHLVRFDTDKLLDYTDFPLASAAKIATKPTEVSDTGTLINADTVLVDGWDVAKWFKQNGRGIGEKLIEALRDYPDEELIRAPRSDDKTGTHIACPFEDGHSSISQGGTFIDPKDGEEDYPKIYCSHSHCVGNLTETFIGGMLNQGWITKNDLIAMAKRAPQESALSSMGLSAHTLSANINRNLEDDDTPVVDLTDVGPKDTTADQVEIINKARWYASPENQPPASIMKRLRDARIAVEVAGIIQEVGIEGPAFRIFALAASGLSYAAVKIHYKKYSETLDIVASEFCTLVLEIRNKVLPINEAIKDVVTQNVQNTELKLILRDLAMRYNYSVREVEDMFYAEHTELNVSMDAEEKKLMERALEFNKTHAKYSTPKATYILDMDKSREKGALEYKSIDAIKTLQSNEGLLIPDARGNYHRVSTFEYWLKNVPTHRVIESAVFEPGQKEKGESEFNLWRGYSGCEPRVGDASPIVDHLKNVWCCGDEAKFNYLMTFFAALFQQPGRKFPVALVVIGGQGTGKSIVFSHCLIPMTAPYSISTGDDAFKGRFNAALVNKKLVVVEEASLNSKDVGGKLKNFISSTTIDIERKGFDTETYSNYIQFVFLSNHENCLDIESGDRRYFVLKTSNEKAKNIPYFEALRAWLETGGREIFMNYLIEWRPEAVGLTWDSLLNAPLTNTKVKQTVGSLSPAQLFISEYATQGDSPFKDVGVPDFDWKMDEPCFIPRFVFDKTLWTGYTGVHRRASSNEARFSTLLTVMENLFGADFNANAVVTLPGQNAVSQCIKLPPRREALGILLAHSIIDDKTYESACQVGDGNA